MALSHQHRSSLYLSLSPVVGTEEAEALLAELPSTSGDELATKDFVRAESALTRAELRHEIDVLRTELRHEIDALRAEMHSMFRRQTVWMASLVIAAFSASTAVNAFVVMAAR